ncbi:hypothetical protein TRFO_20856 [Tritrichomonas foetus]|uniref:DnaK protein n=1 Tax=Tritrichomonas foetus TaxID=1144522 RepID=A0A1J4KGI3_9EUKA|nr:hypothetical protein TRFO_20856 [Tritrichomonas foetus]|eukprot:OHT10048.1 hypothetical protein TRFO_20856 [Tritrichomonas foetus]
MNLFFFFIQIAFSSYGAIDLGTQYIKVSVMDINGNIRIVPNSKNKMMTPSAVAFKLEKYPNRHLTMVESLRAQVKIGDDALRILKNNPKKGSEFVPRLIGRNLTSHITNNFTDHIKNDIKNTTTGTFSGHFTSPDIADPSEMLGFLFKEIFSSPEFTQMPGSVVAVPAYYTFEQRRDINDAMWAAQANYYGTVDDNQAIATLYSIRFAKRFSEKPQDILFVDIGAASSKAYRCHFSMNKTTNPPTPLANVTSYEFTENCGGQILAMKLASIKNISPSKAQKLLKANSLSNYDELFEDELYSLSRMIKLAINGPIDQIQIFGGASRFQFLIDTISKVVGTEIEIKKELPAFDAVAFGAIHALQDMQNLSVYQFPNLTRSSPYNSYVECGGVIEDFCYKSANCTEAALLENTMCDYVHFLTDYENVPEGCSNILGKFELVNISRFPKQPEEGAGGFLTFKEPSPILTGALWCRNTDLYCDPIVVKHAGSTELQREKKLAFVETVLKGQKEMEKMILLKAKINEISERIINFLENNENEKESYEIEKQKKEEKEENQDPRSRYEKGPSYFLEKAKEKAKEREQQKIDDVRIESMETINYVKQINEGTHNNLKLETLVEELERIARYIGVPLNEMN